MPRGEREDERGIVIISHEHRFVFVKTHKTAGTSIEVLLGGIAGADAIVTPIEPPVEGHVARNYEIAGSPTSSLLRRARRGFRKRASHPAYFNHISAAGIQRYLGSSRWESYFTFCFERNPWEKAVSRYFFAQGRNEFGGTFREYVLGGNLSSDFDLYSLDGETVAVDFVGRYENLDADLRSAFDRIGLRHEVSLTHEKGNYRPVDATADAMFDDEMSHRVETEFAREIRAFGYTRPSRLTAPSASDAGERPD